MSENRKIGFEVLENADENKIKEMGADSPILTQNAKERMLKMSKEKFNKAKGITAEENTNTENYEYTVSGNAEEYKRSNIKRIVTAAASCAAALVLIGTTALMLHKKPDSPVVPDQNITKDSDPNATDTGTTVTNTGTATTTTETTYTTVTTYKAKDFNITSPVPQSDIEAAREKVLDAIDRENQYAYDVRYKYEDLNADNVPELLVVYQNAYPVLEIYRYNGSEFVYDINEYGFNANSISFTNDFGISSDGKCIKLMNKEGGTVYYYVTMGDDYSIETNKIWATFDWEYDEKHRDETDYNAKSIYHHNEDVISEEEYNSLRSTYDAIEFTNYDLTEFTLYKEKTTASIEREQRMQEEERQREEYEKEHPHCNDCVFFQFATEYWENLGILDGSTDYTLYHIDTYCDGTTQEDTREEPFLYLGEENHENIVSATIYYGDNDYGPCHSVIYLCPKNGQEKIKLIEADIDFKNKTWTVSDPELEPYISPEFYYPSTGNYVY